MQLSKETLSKLLPQPGLEIPVSKLFELPEKVLQFGTGVLLRGLPDYFIDKANKAGVFNGRIVVVKSTNSDSSAFDKQNGLYTIAVRGIMNGDIKTENIINASISRVLSANEEWKRILECAHNREMKIIISNTTEVGIQLMNDNINDEPPVSFPGKLLAFLYERYKAFNGSAESGMVIIPTELITDNGTKLESIVVELAHLNNLDFQFIEWLETNNTFCNSLVDRIVPGKPQQEVLQKIEEELGYQDELLTMSEVFRLWAIQGDETVKEVLSFATIDDGVKITSDITLFKELKLRLLNATHTFNCGLAYLAGFNLTREAISDEVFSLFTRKLMHQEISPAIPFGIDENVKIEFANNVFDRFANPFIDHQWLSITVQCTSKMKMRNVPLLLQHYLNTDKPPLMMAAGFAGFLLFMKAVRHENGRYYGERDSIAYEIKDAEAGYFFDLWSTYPSERVVELALQNKSLWDTDLFLLPGFCTTVQELLQDMQTDGVLQTIAGLSTNKVVI